jgi:carbonic anhydrase/acetyltransferase-like protein (isoleucine patch superfamily)
VPVYALGDMVPTIDPTAYVHPDAVIIGDVRLGPESSVWPCAVLRGDESYIEIGARTSVQDGSVLHCTRHLPTVIGEESVIGHMVHLEGCTVERGALVGNGAVVLHEVVVQTRSIVGSNAVVTNGTVVPTGAMALGVPAKIYPDRVTEDWMIWGPMHSYVERAALYRQQLRRVD